MPREVYKIIDFSGGLNSNNDPRDLIEGEGTEFAELQNVSVHRGGMLKVSGDFDTSHGKTVLKVLQMRVEGLRL